MKKIVSTDAAPKAIGHYSQAISANGFVFCSGQIPLKPTGELETGDIKAQTTQVMENLKAVLAKAGTSFENVVKTTIFLADMNDFALVNEVYGSYFKIDPPARATIQVARLPKDVKVEIEAIASSGN